MPLRLGITMVTNSKIDSIVDIFMNKKIESRKHVKLCFYIRLINEGSKTLFCFIL